MLQAMTNATDGDHHFGLRRPGALTYPVL